MRGTLHLLSSAEFPLWQTARSTTRRWETGAWQRGFGVTLKSLERLNDAVAQALEGQLLTREELAGRVGELTGSRRLLVTIEPFAGKPPARVRRAAEAEAERLAAWSGGQLELAGPTTSRRASAWW